MTALAVVLAGCSSSTSRPSVLWAFEGGAISADGKSIELDAYGIHDPSCIEFDRVVTAVSGDELVVSLFYLGPTEGQFCNIPCPLDTERLVIPLDSLRDPGLTVVKNPDTGEHCSERLAN